MISLVKPTYPANALTWTFVDVDPVSEWHPDLTEFGYDYHWMDLPDPDRPMDAPEQIQYSPTTHDKKSHRLTQVIVPIGEKQDRVGLEAKLRQVCAECVGTVFVSLKDAN